jgi:NRPS condensation-like uncharacterized protein
MTIRADIAQAAPRACWPANSPFSNLDELNCYFDSAAEPNNVHLEAWLPGHLSPQRLAAAVAAVLTGRPAARARRGAGPWWRAGYAWELPPQADVDPVSVAAWRDEAELDLTRERFLAAAPRLDRSPPFRLLLAQGPQWDGVILNAHHAAFDGRSCLRLLRLIADRYSAPPGSGPIAGSESITGSRSTAGSGSTAGSRSTARSGGLALRTGRSARIAAQHKDPRASRGAPGYGLHLLEWPGIPAAPDPRGHPPVTVNDLLIAALIETIARWNAARRRRPARIRISMPIDARPPGHGDQLGNHSRLATVTVDPRRGADVPATVAAQTRAAKGAPGPPASPVLMATARTRLPAGVKRRLVRLGLRSLGSIGCDSSLLSNLGNVTDPPAFGMLTPTRMWFSTSAHMPRGLSVGAITVGGRLQLCFRYRNALLDPAAGRDFAAEYAAALTALTALAEPAGGAAGAARETTR